MAGHRIRSLAVVASRPPDPLRPAQLAKCLCRWRSRRRARGARRPDSNLGGQGDLRTGQDEFVLILGTDHQVERGRGCFNRNRGANRGDLVHTLELGSCLGIAAEHETDCSRQNDRNRYCIEVDVAQ